MNNGIEEVEIRGVKRGFKFGPRSVALAEREDGCAAGQLFTKMAAGDQLAVLNMFYGAALDYCNVNKLKVDFNSSEVADWVFEIGLEKSMDILTKGLNTYSEKNLVAPQLIATSGNGQSQT